MNEQVFESYFEAIAEALKAIAHNPAATKNKRFFRFDEVFDGLRAKADSEKLILLIKNEEGQVERLGSGALTERHDCAFYLLRKASEGDFAAQKQAHQDALAAGRQILGRMAEDKRQGHALMRYLLLNGVSFEKLGPTLDGLYGYQFNFRLATQQACDYKYDETNWEWK